MDIFDNVLQAPVSLALAAATALAAALVTFTSVHPTSFLFTPTLVFEQGQYWRLLTTFLYIGKFDMESALYVYWYYSLSSLMEKRYFVGRSLDYALVLVLGCACFVVARLYAVIDTPFLTNMLEMMIAYLSSRLQPDMQVNFMLLLRVPMRVMPLFQLLMMAVHERHVGGAPLVSFLVAHTLWYMLEIFPRITGVHVLRVQERLARLLRGEAPPAHVHVL